MADNKVWGLSEETRERRRDASSARVAFIGPRPDHKHKKKK